MKTKDRNKIFFIILLLAIFSIVSFFIMFKIIIKLNGDPNDIYYTSNSLDNTTYEVYLEENSLIEENVLDENNSYILDLVNLININYNYNYSLDKDLNYTYNYNVIATLEGIFNEEVLNPLLNKEYILLNKLNLKGSKTININETINIEPLFYNEIIKEFINNFNINISANLKVKLNINYKGDINNNHYIELIIPLNKKAFDITKTNNLQTEEIFYIKEPLKKEDAFSKIIINIIVLTLLYITGIYLIKNIRDKHLSKYTKTLNKILKEYDDRIVEVKSFVKYKNWEKVDLKSFDELINLSNEAFEPIFFWKRRYTRKKEVWFCILRDKVLYRYIIRAQSVNDGQNRG